MCVCGLLVSVTLCFSGLFYLCFQRLFLNGNLALLQFNFLFLTSKVCICGRNFLRLALFLGLNSTCGIGTSLFDFCDLLQLRFLNSQFVLLLSNFSVSNDLCFICGTCAFCFCDSDFSLRLCLCFLSVLGNLYSILNTQILNHAVSILEVLDIKRSQLQTKVCKVRSNILHDLFSKLLLVSLNQLFQSSLRDNFTDVTFQNRLDNLLNIFDRISKKLRCGNRHALRVSINSHVGNCINIDIDSILGRNLITRRKVYLNILQRHIVNTLNQRNDETSLTMNSLATRRPSNNHSLIGRCFLIARLKNNSNQHNRSDNCNQRNKCKKINHIFSLD